MVYANLYDYGTNTRLKITWNNLRVFSQLSGLEVMHIKNDI